MVTIINGRQNKHSQKLKIGLIVDSNYSSKYVYDLASWAKEQMNLEVSLIIIQRTQNNLSRKKYKRVFQFLKKNGVINFIETLGFMMIHKIEIFFLKKIEKYKDHFEQFNLLEVVNKSIEVSPVISKSGFVFRYSNGDLEKIRSESLDVLIRCGSGILKGEILTVCKYGIISFHHADSKINRGGPAGFWEAFNKDDSTGFTIQQLTDELDGGNVLFQGHFTTQDYYLLNQAYLYAKSNFYMKKVLSDLATTRDLPAVNNSLPYFNKLYKRPTIKNQILYIGSLVMTKLSRKFIYKFSMKKYDRWGVAFQFTNWRNLVMWKSVKIKNPPNHFLADPFVVSENNKHYCFVEDFDYSSNKGCIGLYELNESFAISKGAVIVEPFHLSYPYVFKFQSKYYLVPETSINRDIRLYEAEEFPLKWKFLKTIFTNIDAVDTTIFEKDNTWWLFTNIDCSQSGDYCSELSIFYSDNPLADNWIPHPKNPVICNSLNARMGGILFDDSQIYRVSQKQGIGRYGKASNLNKIIRLSKTDYLEELQLTIQPNFFNNLLGTHHLHSNGEVTVFDFVERSNLK